MSLFYYTGASTMKALLLLLTDWEVRGRERVPLNGPLIIVSNHLNLADPPLLSASIPRKIHFMVKEELYYSRRGGIFIKAYGAFPVRRGKPDKRAVSEALKLLSEGKAIGMFPEGTRNPERKLQRGEGGTALIARLSGAPILPVGISGTEGIRGLYEVLSRRLKIRVNIGEPFYLPDGDIHEQTEFIMKRIANLLPEEYRGIYASCGES